jgi:hypothetical protein
MAIRCVLITVACLSCLGCRAAAPVGREDPASLADDPAATRVGAETAARDGVVVAYYFHKTFRCISCLSMETMAVHAIEGHFAQQVQDGRVVWTPVNIEDPTTKALQQQLEVRGNGLVLVRMENGVYRESKRLDELWGLLDHSDAFSKYLVDQINAYLSSVQGG